MYCCLNAVHGEKGKKRGKKRKSVGKLIMLDLRANRFKEEGSE